MLPVADPLVPLLPGGGLRRGSTVAVPRAPGATSLLLALLAETSAGGAWAGVVGRPELGLVAAAEAGVRLERLALVPRPGADLMAVTVALLDGMDVVAVAGAERAGVRGRRPAAACGQGPAARVRCCWRSGRGRGPTSSWAAGRAVAGPGLRGGGGGRLCARRVRVQLRGRGVAPGGRGAGLLLPAAGGGGRGAAGGADARPSAAASAGGRRRRDAGRAGGRGRRGG